MTMQPEPRVRLTYPQKTPQGMQERELPFVVGVLAELSGRPDLPIGKQQFVDIRRDTFDDVLAAIAPGLAFTPEGGSPFVMRFQRREDFEPQEIARRAGSSEKADAIFQSIEFKRLAATWQAIFYLASQADPHSNVKLRILDAGRRMLQNDLKKAPSFDQTFLFKHVHDSIYGVRDGEPFALLIGDYQFGPQAEDLELLSGLAKIAASAQTPFLAAASPELFGGADFKAVAERRQNALASAPDTISLGRWSAFRQQPASEFVSLTVPRILLRPPEPPYAQAVWGNAAFALAGRAIASYQKYGWPAALQGAEAGIAEDLPVADAGCVDAAFDDMQEPSIVSHGVTCLMRLFDGRAAFFSTPMCSDAKLRYGSLRYAAPLARIMQYLKMLACELSTQGVSPEQCQAPLQEWLDRYVLEGAPGKRQNPRYPLAAAHIEVIGPAGRSSARVSLRPNVLQAEDQGIPAIREFPLGG